MLSYLTVGWDWCPVSKHTSLYCGRDSSGIDCALMPFDACAASSNLEAPLLQDPGQEVHSPMTRRVIAPSTVSQLGITCLFLSYVLCTRLQRSICEARHFCFFPNKRSRSSVSPIIFDDHHEMHIVSGSRELVFRTVRRRGVIT
jgi:hypothetical protein